MKDSEEQNHQPDRDEEHELILRCILKEKAAWDEFVERYSRFIYHRIHSCLRAHSYSACREDVEDLYNSVFQGFLENNCKKLRQFEGRCSLLSWIKLITSRMVIDYLRRQRTLVSLDAEDDQSGSLGDRLTDSAPSAEEGVLEEERRERLKRALEAESPEDRLLAVLTYERELPVEEIAEIMKISKEAVYTRRSRLKDRLREALEEKEI